MGLSLRTRRSLMWAAWTVMCVSGAMLIGLMVGRPLYYSDGDQQILGGDVPDAGMLRWSRPDAQCELPGKLTGRVSRLPDGRLLYGVLQEDGTSDLVTWHPERKDVPPEPAYGLNTAHNELAPAVGSDGRIYFASDRPDGMGGYDLYVSALTPRGFARAEPLLACNTAFDETDPAPDPRGISLVFARIDRAIDNGNDGVLFQWQLGDVLDPTPVFPDLNRRRERVIDRDPAFAADGASLWFVRKVLGQELAVCRSSRLGEALAKPMVLSQNWHVPTLRSPLPLPGGRSLAMVQPGQGEQPALWYVAAAEELVPWWPGQHWLEWLLLSLLLCSLLLLMLLYFGQRWTALDLVAQCLLLSLLLHVLLFLWLMGVEIAGSLLPGTDNDDNGMQVSIVASTVASMTAAGSDGGIAAKVQRSMRQQDFAIVAPGTQTARSSVAAAASLSVANGSYAAEPMQRSEQLAAEQSLQDAAAAVAATVGEDATPALKASPADEVAQAATASVLSTARNAASGNQASHVVQVTTPGSGLQRAPGRALALRSADAAAALPLRGTPSLATNGTSALLKDAVLEDAVAAVGAEATAEASEPAIAAIDRKSDMTMAQAPTAAVIANPQRASESPRAAAPLAAEQVPMPNGKVARAGSAMIALPARERAMAISGPRAVALPAVRLPDRPLQGDAMPATASSLAASAGASSKSMPRAKVSSLQLPGPSQTEGNAAQAARSERDGREQSSLPTLPQPGSALPRSAPAIAMRSPGLQPALPTLRGGGAAVTLRDAGEAITQAQPRAVAATSQAEHASGLHRSAAHQSRLPNEPAVDPSFAPRRAASQRSNAAGAFAERIPVTPPATVVARAASRASSLPRPTAPPVAKSAYSNRFGPAKAQALEQFGGTVETERAVRDGLAYLASIQNRNGSWGNQRDFDSKYGFVYIGKTALCVLAFLGAGHTPTSNSDYSEVVSKAIQHLLSVQEADTGAFGRSSCYGHGIATYAIAECYGLTKDKAYGDRLAQPLEDSLTWILANQGPRSDARNRGGWGYFSPGLRADDSYARVSVSSWMIMALESARLSGVELPEDALPAARQFLELSFDRENGWFRYNHKPSRLRSAWPTLPASTPAGGFCLMLLGKPANDRMVTAAVDYTVARRPERYRRYRDDDFVLRGQGNVYFWYYGTLCSFLKGGDAWQQWNERLSTVLPAAQQADGSFPPIDVYAEEAGDTATDRSYTTAMCVLSLEVYYRYFTPLLLGR